MKKIFATLLAICLVACCLLSACNSPTPPNRPNPSETNKVAGRITDIQDISKIYDGKAVSDPTFNTNNTDGKVTFTYYEKGSTTAIPVPINAGNYTVKVSVAEGSTVQAVEATADFSIEKAVAVYTVPEKLAASAGSQLRDIDISAYGLAWVHPDTVVNESGIFSAKVSVDNNYYPDDTVVNISVVLVNKVVAVPSLSVNSFKDDGSTHTISTADIIDFDANLMEISANSTLSASKVGTYTVVISLLDRENNCWANNLTEDIVLTWHIGSYKIVFGKGTENCYNISQNDNGEITLTFTAVTEKTQYSVFGEINGNIVIDVGNDFKFELEMCGLTLSSRYEAPISVLSGDEVTLTAKNGYNNFAYDNRPEASDEADACVYSKVDLTIGGKGSWNIISQNNGGIHTKDDLEIKNLSLHVQSSDNALKGNDSVSVLSGNLTIISTKGDGIKTSNSDLSSKQKQRGTVSVAGGDITIYAACDGIDAAYNVEISGGTLGIFTDKYSPYSEEVTALSGGMYYIGYNSKSYNFSVKYLNDSGEFVWKNATYYTSKQTGGRPGQNSYTYFYKVEKPAGYTEMEVYLYNSSQQQGQAENYVARTVLTVNNSYDTMSLSNNNGSLRCNWTNFSTVSSGGGRPGGMQEGNSDKGDHSTKGLKADNEVQISGGVVTIQSYDDGIHANSTSVIQSTNANGAGDVNVSGGTVTLCSNDDGIHADGNLTISNGTVKVTNSYEGLEGTVIHISGGNISVVSKDDGVNGTGTSGNSLIISGGILFVYAGGDGLDSNSRTSYGGILFEGGKTVVINTSGGNSPIDTESGYQYVGGAVVAIGASNGMWNESIKCSNFSQVGCYKTNVNAQYISVAGIATVNMPKIFSAVVIVLGGGTSNSAITTSSTSSETFDENGVCWNI